METSRRDVFFRGDDNNQHFLSICLGTGMFSLVWLWQGLHGVSRVSGWNALHYSRCEINVRLAPNSSWISPSGPFTTIGNSVVPSKYVRACVVSCYSCVWLFGVLWTVVHQAPLSLGCFRQEYWSGLPCPPPGDLPDSGIESASLMSPALAGVFFPTSTTWEFYSPVVFSHQSHGIQRLLIN